MSMNADKLTRRALSWRTLTALPCLPRATAITFTRRLASARHRSAECVNTMLKEY